MSDEIRQAAERLRRSAASLNPGECIPEYRGVGGMDQRYRDIFALKNAYLAEHPADGPSDSEMLDWLEEHEATVVENYRGQCLINDEDGHGMRAAIRQAMSKGA